MQSNCSSLNRWQICGLMKTPSLNFCSTDSWEFLSEIPKSWPCMIHSPNKFLGWKSLLHKNNRNHLHCSSTFAASFLRFGQEMTAWHSTKMLHCERRLSEISSTSVYNATPCKELKCNRLVISIFGGSLHHSPRPLHCFILLINSKWLTQCLSDDGITHVTIRVATSLLTPTQCPKQCKAYKLGPTPDLWN